ncbi:Glycoside hydrolase family 16 protein [Mycena kentingensis (nom. inval.)]|nr:Glycoside hydrolase family 16 protein [Mycena kentingensis (nom. inval.)]
MSLRHSRALSFTLLFLASFQCVAALKYQFTSEIVGFDFLEAFSAQNISDPTHGRVNYVDAATAQSQNLTFASADTFLLRADATTVLSANGTGEAKFRSIDVKAANNDRGHNVDLTFSTCPKDVGEVDILEGVNDQGPNQSTLHTNAGCTVPLPSPARPQTGTAVLNNCDVAATGNSGCGVKSADPHSYGPAFNANGGGWYAAEINPAHIRVWFWPRNASLPKDVAGEYGYADVVDTSGWGSQRRSSLLQRARFRQNSDPRISSSTLPSVTAAATGQANQPFTPRLDAHRPVSVRELELVRLGFLIFSIDFVDNNPLALSEAYFEFNSLRTFDLVA